MNHVTHTYHISFSYLVGRECTYLSCVPGVDGKIHPKGCIAAQTVTRLATATTTATFQFCTTLFSVVVSVTARAEPLSLCDGDVRVLLPEKPGELNIAFKPNVFNTDSNFYIVFTNPETIASCKSTNTEQCVVDTNKGVYYVRVRGLRNAGGQLSVRIDNYASGCGAATQRTLYASSIQFSL